MSKPPWQISNPTALFSIYDTAYKSYVTCFPKHCILNGHKPLFLKLLIDFFKVKGTIIHIFSDL